MPALPSSGGRIGVLFVANYSPWAVGGVGQFMIDLGTHLSQRGFDVGMCFRAEPREADLPPRIARVPRIEVWHTSLSPLRTLHLLYGTARALIGIRRKYKVWHVIVPQPMTALAAFLAKILGIPVVATVFAPYPRTGRKVADLMQRWSEAVVLSLADLVAYECESTRRQFPREGVVVLNGIDTGFFHPDETRRVLLRAKLGLPPKAVIVLFLGRITQSKGVHELLAAFARLGVERADGLELLLVGPVETAVLEDPGSEPHPTQNVRFVGPVGKDAVLDFYQVADLFVLPSHQEGISSSLVEAMACALPAIVSNVGGSPEVVVHGETGLIIEPGNVEALRVSLADLVQDDRERRAMGHRARERIVARFGLAGMADGYADGYAWVLRARAR